MSLLLLLQLVGVEVVLLLVCWLGRSLLVAWAVAAGAGVACLLLGLALSS